MRKLTILINIAVLAGGAGFAHTKNVNQPCMTVGSLDTKEGCGKIHAIDRNGGEAELFVDLTSDGSARKDD